MDTYRLFNELFVAIREDKFEEFSRLLQGYQKIFKRLHVECSLKCSLTNYAITKRRKKIFDYLVNLQTSKDLSHVLKYINFSSGLDLYFSYTLVEKGASLKVLRSTNFPGHHVANLEMMNFFLNNGLDPNFQNKRGEYLLPLVLTKLHENYESTVDEMVAMLLVCGVDPTRVFFIPFTFLSDELCYRDRNAFEIVCLFNVSDFIFEQLFLYTFDDGQLGGRIHLSTFMILAGKQKHVQSDVKSFWFNKMLDYGLDFVASFEDGKDLLNKLLSMDFDCFEALVQRCPKAVHVILKKTRFFDSWPDNFKERMEYLIVKNNFYFNCVILFFENLDADVATSKAIHFANDEVDATTLILFMIEYGLKCNVGMLHVVYISYGDCVLFRTLLHLDMEEYSRKDTYKSAMASFISDINLSVQVFVDSISEKQWVENYLLYRTTYGVRCYLSTPFGYLSADEASDLLDFFAHPKLIDFLLKTENLPERILKKIHLLPRVPSLQELARDAFRKHLIDRFHVKSTKQFYSLVNGLFISAVHRKIITFEKKLYYAIVLDE